MWKKGINEKREQHVKKKQKQATGKAVPNGVKSDPRNGLTLLSYVLEGK